MNLSVRLTRAAKCIEELEAQLEETKGDDNRLRWMLAWTTLELEKAANTRFDELKGWMGQLDFPNLDLAHVILDGEVE